METKPVNMRLSQNTLDKIDWMESELKAPNRTQVVVHAIRIANELIRTLSEGGKIIIEKPDGSRERLLLPNY